MIDGTRAGFIDHDIMETMEDFMKAASDNNIRVELKNMRGLQQPVPEMAPGVRARTFLSVSYFRLASTRRKRGDGWR